MGVNHAPIGFLRGHGRLDEIHDDILLNRSTIWTGFFLPIRIPVAGLSHECEGAEAIHKLEFVNALQRLRVILTLQRLADFEHCDGRGFIVVQFGELPRWGL